MNVTRDVVADLLPVYFSGDASSDTRSLVDNYFKEHPDFERIARGAGTPLETLRVAQPIAAGSEEEKRDLESVRGGLQRRKWLFGLCLFLTLSPLTYFFTHGHLDLLMVRDAVWEAAFDWSMAAVFWFLYFARVRWRTASLVSAISLTLIPIPFVLHFARVPELRGAFAEAVCIWIGAALIWAGYFRQRPHYRRAK
jgi:hypothetical protein